jgi:hypothetical protein
MLRIDIPTLAEFKVLAAIKGDTEALSVPARLQANPRSLLAHTRSRGGGEAGG